ncbi:hypothetical protein [Micromonospora humi]|uniref:Membrane-associated oxidoreductase n=1 Tax=Micromonospora humi TaxID=745366 RepID=A0A1C5JPK7_9ACTN|nr:hypothetical protein [Micromonospora humi]SCG72448.1 hypothetical protein GA0070213_112190 [Micromonospora humi]
MRSGLGELSPAEQRLWDAFPRGETVAPHEDTPHVVRAAVIRSLLLGGRDAEPGHRPALRLHGAEVVGVLDLYQAEIEHAVEFVGCVFDATPQLSFAQLRGMSFEGSTLPGLDAFGAVVQGTLSLVKCVLSDAVVVYGLQVSGDLDLDWARLASGGRAEDVFGDRTAALFGDALHVGRHLYLQGTTAAGNVELAGVRIGGTLHAQRGCRIDGELRLPGAQVAGEVDLSHAVLVNPGGVALDARGLRVGQLTLLAERVEGTVDLRHSQTEVLRDEPDRWPARLRLDGARYAALERAGTSRERLCWLNRDPDGYRPQPYEQLAALYRQIGQDSDARAVLLAKQRRRRRLLPPAAAAWGLAQDGLVGYGYRPGRALLWLSVLAVLGATVFSGYPPVAAPGGTDFNPLVYTLDLLIPIVQFGQEQTYRTEGPAQWLAYLLMAIGWLLFTAVAAALTRTLNRF